MSDKPKQHAQQDSYTLEEAYVITGRGVGRFDAEKASQSESFIAKAKALANNLDKINIQANS